MCHPTFSLFTTTNHKRKQMQMLYEHSKRNNLTPPYQIQINLSVQIQNNQFRFIIKWSKTSDLSPLNASNSLIPDFNQ